MQVAQLSEMVTLFIALDWKFKNFIKNIWAVLQRYCKELGLFPQQH